MGAQAFYRLSARVLSRSKGHTAVGYAAYLSSEKLVDEKYGVTRRFDRPHQQQRLHGNEILAPDNAPAWVYNREQLFNRIEAAEKRKDSQLVREVQLSFPKELTHEQKRKAAREFVQQQYVSKGMIADISYHNFKGKNKGGGEDNPHAHVLLTMRRVERNGFAAKKETAWQPDFSKKAQYVHAEGDALKAERQAWERQLNRTLEGAGRSERVDCRSLKERNINRLPEPKKGRAHDMEQRPQWRGLTRACDEWRAVRNINTIKLTEEKRQTQIAEIEKKLRQAQLDAAIEHGKQEVEKKQKARAAEQERHKQEQLGKAIIDGSKAARRSKPSDTSDRDSEREQDDREQIRLWQQFKDNEREHSPSRLSGQNAQGAPPERDDNLDKKLQNLQSAMDEFQSQQEQSKTERSKREDRQRRRPKKYPPPDEPERDRSPKR